MKRLKEFLKRLKTNFNSVMNKVVDKLEEITPAVSSLIDKIIYVAGLSSIMLLTILLTMLLLTI